MLFGFLFSKQPTYDSSFNFFERTSNFGLNILKSW
jgi:hypothetical protein